MKEVKVKKTPDYTARAHKNYEAKFDRTTINFPKGTKDFCKTLDMSVNAYINQLVSEDLERRGIKLVDGEVVKTTPKKTSTRKPKSVDQPPKEQSDEDYAFS